MTLVPLTWHIMWWKVVGDALAFFWRRIKVTREGRMANLRIHCQPTAGSKWAQSVVIWFVWTYTKYMCICMHMLHLHVYMYDVCMYVCMYVWMYGCICGCMHVWMCGCMDVCMDACMDVCMYDHVCMYECMDLNDLWMYGWMDAWMHGCMDVG